MNDPFTSCRREWWACGPMKIEAQGKNVNDVCMLKWRASFICPTVRLISQEKGFYFRKDHKFLSLQTWLVPPSHQAWFSACGSIIFTCTVHSSSCSLSSLFCFTLMLWVDCWKGSNVPCYTSHSSCVNIQLVSPLARNFTVPCVWPILMFAT